MGKLRLPVSPAYCPPLSIGRYADPAYLDFSLLRQIEYLKSTYKRSGDPRIVFLAAASLVQEASTSSKSGQSFQFARLLALMSEMLIAEGQNETKLTLALQLIEHALTVLQNVPNYSVEVLKAHVDFTLYRAIALKSLGRFDDGLDAIRETITLLSARMGQAYADLIPLHRQEAMMQQDLKGHRALAEQAASYARSHPVEYYATLKRIFEFSMNRRRPETPKLFPEFRRAYSAIRHRLPPLSHVSFVKNVGQYRLQSNDPTGAHRLFALALASSNCLNLFGQSRQIGRLIDDVEGNTDRGLITFRVK